MKNLLVAITIIWALVSFPFLGALGGALLSFVIVDGPALDNFTNEEWVSLGAPPEKELLSIQAGDNKGYLQGISGKAYVTCGRILEEAGCWKEIGEIPDYLDIGQQMCMKVDITEPPGKAEFQSYSCSYDDRRYSTGIALLNDGNLWATHGEYDSYSSWGPMIVYSIAGLIIGLVLAIILSTAVVFKERNAG